MLDRVKTWIAEREKRRREVSEAEYDAARQRHALEWDGEGMRIVEVGIECGVHQRVKWGEIKKVLALKLDCWSIDHVVMIVATESSTIRLNEDMAQFWEFLRELPNHLPGAMGWEEFWDRVVQPPVETCLTTVYEAQQR